VRTVFKSKIESYKQLAKDCTDKENIKDSLKAVAKKAGKVVGNMV
jgi:hypothetical protein